MSSRFFYTALMIILLAMLSGCQAESKTELSKTELTLEAALTVVEGRMPDDDTKNRLLAAKEDLFKKLSGRLTAAMNEGGPSEAVEVCYRLAPDIANEVGEKHNVRIGRSGVRLRNSRNTPPVWAKSFVESKTETPTFVTLSNEKAAALLPIKLQSQCLMCHGPVEQITDDVQRVLSKRYPNDQATGFRDGELRGWFWVEEL